MQSTWNGAGAQGIFNDHKLNRQPLPVPEGGVSRTPNLDLPLSPHLRSFNHHHLGLWPHPKDRRHWTFFFFFSFWPRQAACGNLVPQPGIEPMPPAAEAWSLNHWTAREVPGDIELLSSNLPSVTCQWLVHLCNKYLFMQQILINCLLPSGSGLRSGEWKQTWSLPSCSLRTHERARR